MLNLQFVNSSLQVLVEDLALAAQAGEEEGIAAVKDRYRGHHYHRLFLSCSKIGWCRIIWCRMGR